MLEKIKRIIDLHHVPCEIEGEHINVRAYMDSDEVSDVISFDNGLYINGVSDTASTAKAAIYAWLGY